MKLPTDKQERIKLLVLIALGVIGMLYGLTVGVVNPLLRGRREKAQKIEELQAKIDRARGIVNRAAIYAKLNAELIAEVVENANRRHYVLHDRLGNYLLSAQDILERHARESGVALDAVSEVGLSQIPSAAPAGQTTAFRAYTAHVSLHAGLHELIKFLRALESANPYLCLSALNITAQSAQPAVHDISLDVQWPVWAGPEISDRLERQMQESGPRPAANAAAESAP